MATAQLNPIEIFRPGKQTPTSGAARVFTAEHLKRAAEVYDPALHRAPFVIGHPKTDDLAYGHASALNYSEAERRLIAAPADVEPAFAEMVGDGRLLAVSASFYTPDSPANPVPGSYYLRHVGFLGAEPPAVKGLKRPSVQFAEAEEGVIEFADWQDSQIASLFRGLRDWVIGKFGLEEADRALPAWTVQNVADLAATQTDDADLAPTSYSEGEDVTTTQTAAHTTAQLQAQADQLAADRAALDRRDIELQARENAAALARRTAEFSEFIEPFRVSGKVTPPQRLRLLALAGALPAEHAVEFSEGGAAVKVDALQALKDLVQTLPTQVEFSERAAPRKGLAGVDMTNAQAIQAAAVEFREAESKAGRTVSVEAAVQHIVDSNEEA